MVLIFLIIMFCYNAFSAPTVTESGDFVMVSEIDADFIYTESCVLYGRDGMGVPIDWILFIPGDGWGTGTLGCYVEIKDASDTGPVIFYSQACDLTDDPDFLPIYYHGSKIRPVIDFSVSSVAHDESKVIFKLWRQ